MKITTSRALRQTALRRIALLAHRYVGLVLVVFLVTAGVTGTVVSFHEELDAWMNPELFEIPDEERELPNLDPFEVTARVDAQLPPGRRFGSVVFDVDEGRSISGWVELQPSEWHEWFVSPKSGRILGTRTFGDLSEGRKGVLSFIYRLHYSLGLGDVGSVLLGVIALLWTLDCFVGAYLTFPQPGPGGALTRRFFSRWLPAWGLRTRRLFSFVFTWHRASGLWLWALLLVFAWSGVGFNLRQVYRPVMSALVGMKPEGHELLPHLEPPYPEPRLTLQEAHERGRKEMAREARQRGFSIERELFLYYAEDHRAYGYAVESSLDLSKRQPRTEVYIDAQTGRFLGFDAATGISTGNTISNWFYYLHIGAVFGLWYQSVVALVGILVTALSVTGVWIWWRKRNKVTVPQRRRSRVPKETAPRAEALSGEGETGLELGA